MKKLLIVVDMQNDFVTGSLGSPQAQAIVPNVIAKIKEYQNNYNLIIFTRDTHYENYLETQEGKMLPVKHCIERTEGFNIFGNIDSECSTCQYINKNSFGYINWKDSIGNHLDTLDEIELCGLCTDICVVSNALILKALFPEIKISVDARCCAGVSDESHKASLLTMKMCHIHILNE